MITTIVLLTIAAPFITLGMYTAYVAWRFTWNGEGIVDQTAGFLSYLFVMWFLSTRTEEVAAKIPFVSKDLSEMIGWRKDDGKIT